MTSTPNCSTAWGYKSFRPVIDGNILSDFPTKSILAGNFAKVPLIVGWARVILVGLNTKVFLSLLFSATTNETLPSLGSDIATVLHIFCPSILGADVEALIAVWNPVVRLKVSISIFVIQAYPLSTFASENLRLQTLTGDVEFRCAVSPCLVFFCVAATVGSHWFRPSERSWVKSLVKPLHLGCIDTTRRFPP